MVMAFFRGRGDSTLDVVQQTLVTMLEDGRTVFDAASDAVFGGGKSKETKQTVRSTDQEINVAQQNVRRALVMHSSVSNMDLPAVLAYMSIVKDAERVGDNAKNMYDLAKYGANFELAEDHDELLALRDAVGQLIDDCAATFGSQDEAEAQRLIEKADGFLRDYDDRIKAAFRSEGKADQAVARALYFRYLKRITAHLMNMLTALVMPIERLDYYDEAPEDR